MKQYHTELPVVLDTIIENTRFELKLRGEKEVIRYLRSKGDDGIPMVIQKLDELLPEWRTMTSAKDKEVYILSNKMPYRVKRAFHSS